MYTNLRIMYIIIPTVNVANVPEIDTVAKASHTQVIARINHTIYIYVNNIHLTVRHK